MLHNIGLVVFSEITCSSFILQFLRKKYQQQQVIIDLMDPLLVELLLHNHTIMIINMATCIIIAKQHLISIEKNSEHTLGNSIGPYIEKIWMTRQFSFTNEKKIQKKLVAWDTAREREREKRRIHWINQLYLHYYWWW